MPSTALSAPNSVFVPGALAAGKRTGTTAVRQSRLLIVDDDLAIREVAAAMLGHAGYKVTTAGDGVEALRLMGGSVPDLVITDLRMPRMSGFELLRIMRERFPQVPVIAVSGEFSGEALPPGVIADVFLSKDCLATPRFSATIEELLAISPMRTGSKGYSVAKGGVFHLDADLFAVLGRLVEEGKPHPTESLGQPPTGRRPSAFTTSIE
ncbi:MAG TPA: response regulator [Terriglobales bacterium]|nr:response regulator [Terriglobales bacterium]